MHHPCLGGDLERRVDAYRGGRLEAEPRVVRRVPHHDDEGEFSLRSPPQPARDERGARAPSLVRREDSHRRERQHRMAGVQSRTAERDVPYDRAVVKRNEAEL